MRAYIHLVRELVIAHILVVDGQVDELGRRVELQSSPFAHQAGQRIAQQRLVGVVGQQRPLLGIRAPLAQQFHLLMKLQFVRLLGKTGG